ncbi:hypothetical protein KUCAC02_024861, partial [Chaenocephalus aceratus]
MFALRTKPQFLLSDVWEEARCPSELPEKYGMTEDKVRSLVEREELFEGLKRQEAVFNEVNTNIKISNPETYGREEEGDAAGQVWRIQGLQRKPFGLGPGKGVGGSNHVSEREQVTVLAPIRGRGRAVKPMQRFNK